MSPKVTDLPVRTLAAVSGWLLAATLMLGDRLTRPAEADRDDRDRGDVPGWVMITVMTAIVVIALLAVFRDAVLSAVRNAFSTFTGD